PAVALGVAGTTSYAAPRSFATSRAGTSARVLQPCVRGTGGGTHVRLILASIEHATGGFGDPIGLDPGEALPLVGIPAHRAHRVKDSFGVVDGRDHHLVGEVRLQGGLPTIERFG